MADYIIQPSTAHVERTVLTAMIVSDRALRQISLQFKPRYLAADHARRVAEWCLAYQERYDRAPGRDIRELFEGHRRAGLPEEEARLISGFLESISREFDQDDGYNEQLAIDESLKYFRERALTLLKEDLEYHLEGGNYNQAHAAVADWAAPADRVDLGHEPLRDLDGIKAALDLERLSLFSLPGPVGQLISRLERGNTVAIVGKYKVTKSFTSQYMGFHALFSTLNVAWFDFEMGKDRTYRRIFQATCAMPLRRPEGGVLVLPAWDCALNQSGECNRPERLCGVRLLDGEDKKPSWKNRPSDYRPCLNCAEPKLESWFAERGGYGGLTWQVAWEKAQALEPALMGAKLRFQSWPKFSAGIGEVKSTLHVWRHLEGFVPDVIIIDQPSGMKMSGRGDHRHQLDDLWEELCGIAPDLHCLTLVPSQAGGKDVQRRGRLRDSDFAEHGGIGGHIDGSIKIDQDEYEDKPARRVWMSVGYDRDDEPDDRRCCVLQALSIGQPVYDSRFS